MNDSKATNAAATLRALASFPDSTAPRHPRWPRKVRAVRRACRRFKPGDRAYLIGESADQIADALSAEDVPYDRAGNLAVALHAAASEAVPTDVVLLSPACASFDQFESFEARGDEFRRIVEELP